jgi:transposase
MEYFAGLDVSMEETRVCVVDRDGVVIHEAKAPSTPSGIEAALAGAPTCRRVVFETGRMAPMLHHGLTERGLPVVCIESRQASQALKSLATHKTDCKRFGQARESTACLPPCAASSRHVWPCSRPLQRSMPTSRS